MSKQAWYLVAALVLAPAAVAAQATASADGSASAAPPGAQAQVEAALQTAVHAGIPVSLLKKKIAEAEAKGAAEARIAAAVEARVQALIRARDAMARARLQGMTEGDLAVGADAVQAGVSDAALVEINRSTPPSDRAIAIAALTDLVVLGKTSDQAVLEVQGAIRHGREALASLNADTAAQLQVRAAPGVAMQLDGSAGARVELGGIPGRR